MKKLSLILMLAGTIGVTYAQDTYASLEEAPAENKNVKVLHQEYLSAVQDKATPRDAKYLEEIISQWDPKKSSKFDSRKDPFKVMFNSNRGNVSVTFDNAGQVIASQEIYKNVSLPIQLKKVIYHRYKEWNIINSKYKVSYEQDQEVRRTYHITLKKGDDEKRIKVNGDKLL